MAEKKVIEKENWVSSFNLIGTPKISEDYTFKIDQNSQSSNWIYNSMIHRKHEHRFAINEK